METVLQLISDKEFDLSTTEEDGDDSSLDFEDNEETNTLEESEETTEDTKQNPYPENYRSLATIAKKLNTQDFSLIIDSVEKAFPNEAHIIKKFISWEFKKFYKAEDRHQDYYKVYFLNYLKYKKACRREEILKRIWKM